MRERLCVRVRRIVSVGKALKLATSSSLLMVSDGVNNPVDEMTGVEPCACCDMYFPALIFIASGCLAFAYLRNKPFEMHRNGVM
jgi:hypothetical protein